MVDSGRRWRWALVSPDGVASSRMVGVSASGNLSLHHKFQEFFSGTGSRGWSRKKGRETAVVWCGVCFKETFKRVHSLLPSFNNYTQRKS